MYTYILYIGNTCVMYIIQRDDNLLLFSPSDMENEDLYDSVD